MNHLLLIDGGEPEFYDKARRVNDASKLELAINEEMESLMHNHTWVDQASRGEESFAK